MLYDYAYYSANFCGYQGGCLKKTERFICTKNERFTDLHFFYVLDLLTLYSLFLMV